MAKKKRGEAHGGGHGWFVTFADLMGLLVAFFVMLVAFSTQDQAKLQIVAGSMREAFGVQQNVRYSGIIEVDGLPTRPKLKNVARINPEDASSTPGPDDLEQDNKHGMRHEGRQGLRARVRLAAAGAAGPSGDHRDFQAHHGRGDQGRSQYRDRRSGRPLDVPGRQQGAVRAHAPASCRSSPASSRRCRTA